MRKPILAILIVVLSVLLSVGVGLAQEPVTLEFWGGWTGPDGTIMQELVDEYNAANPGVQVNLSVQQWSPLFDQFIAAGSAQQAPDIMSMHPQEIAQFVELGLIEPVTDLVATSEVYTEDAYLPKAWELQFYNDTMYGLPFDLGVHGVYYNVDLFEAAGIEEFPTNQEEMLEAMRLLTLDADGNHPGDEGFDPENIVQYAINMHTNHHAFYQWYALYNQLGGELLSEDGTQCVMDTDKATQAWKWLQDLVYVHYAAPQGQTDYARDFLTGRTAMLVDGPWQIPAMEAAAEESGFNWATAGYPTIFDEPATWGSGHTFTLPVYGDPDKREAAVDFIEWLGSNSLGWLASGQLPVRHDVIESEGYGELVGRDAFVETLQYQELLPNIPKFNEIFAANAPSPMNVMGQRIILENADIRTEVEAACSAITGILSIP